MATRIGPNPNRHDSSTAVGRHTHSTGNRSGDKAVNGGDEKSGHVGSKTQLEHAQPDAVFCFRRSLGGARR